MDSRVLDLNIFYREDWSPETGTTWSETFTIEPYVRVYDDNGAVYNIETGVLIECDEFETQVLAEQFPMEEYGSDFWVFLDETELPTRRIAKVLNGIDLHKTKKHASVLTYTGPTTM
jgi:hypothetical protein